VLVAISGFLLRWTGILSQAANSLNPYNPAVEKPSRAESAQTPDEVVHYLTIAKGQLPESGAVHWWSSKNANFEEIQAKLDEIIIHAEGISLFDVHEERYNTELYAIHAEIEPIQETLVAF
jgi:hypothetical protein